MESEKMLTMKDAAVKLGVCVATVRRWIELGAIKAIKHGHTIRIPEGSISDLVGKETSECIYIDRNAIFSSKLAMLCEKLLINGDLAFGKVCKIWISMHMSKTTTIRKAEIDFFDKCIVRHPGFINAMIEAGIFIESGDLLELVGYTGNGRFTL